MSKEIQIEFDMRVKRGSNSYNFVVAFDPEARAWWACCNLPDGGMTTQADTLEQLVRDQIPDCVECYEGE